MSKIITALLLSIGVTIANRSLVNEFIDHKSVQLIKIFGYTFLVQLLALATFGVSLKGAFTAVYLGIMVTASYIDAKTHLIPNQLIMVLIALSSINMFLRVIPAHDILLGLAIPLGLIILSVLVPRFEKAIGMGDLKLLLAIELLIGLNALLKTMLIACIAFTIVAIILILAKKVSFKSNIPFGPFISFGAIFIILIQS